MIILSPGARADYPSISGPLRNYAAAADIADDNGGH